MSLYDRLVGRKSIRSQRMGRQGVYTHTYIPDEKMF